jgi:hypothetical protein
MMEPIMRKPKLTDAEQRRIDSQTGELLPDEQGFLQHDRGGGVSNGEAPEEDLGKPDADEDRPQRVDVERMARPGS